MRISFQFKTKIQSPNGRLLTPYLETTSINDAFSLFVDQPNGPVKIGFLILAHGYPNQKQYAGESALRLTGITNAFHDKPETEQYKKVGTALMEYVLELAQNYYAGRITLDAIKDSKNFFTKCGFNVDDLATEAEFGKRPSSERSMWCMYLPKENISVLKERFNADRVFIKPNIYTLLDPTVVQKTLIYESGEIISEKKEYIQFKMSSHILKSNEKGGIRDSLSMFRVSVKKSPFLEKKIEIIKSTLLCITIEDMENLATNQKPTYYLITGDQKLYSTCEELMNAKTDEEVSKWQEKYAKPVQYAYNLYTEKNVVAQPESSQQKQPEKSSQSLKK